MKKRTKRTKPVREGIWFSADRPIESVRHDVLNRSAFATGLAASIRAWSGKDSLVIALEGGWGTGKTSVKNMVLENLQSIRSKCPQIIEFSPWQISGTGTLVGTFFQELGIALGVDGKLGAKSGKKLMAYAKRLGLVGDVTTQIGALISLIKPEAGALLVAGGAAVKKSAKVVQDGSEASLADAEAAKKTLADLKHDLGASLASLTRPILVVIDDIDRLTTDEILQVFQLVKVNADFPNLVYLLLFERSIVEKALDRISGDRGHEFLQKIVQVEFHVPYTHRKYIEKALLPWLEMLFEDEATKAPIDKDRWRDLYIDGIGKYFQNLRHVYRFQGSLSFHVAQFKSGKSFEVDPVDLIGLETLRVFEPGLYEQLPSAKRILTRGADRFRLGGASQEEIDTSVKQMLTYVPAERQPQVKAIMAVLFPPISRLYDNDRGVSGDEQQWLRERRVCHTDLFDKFFTLVVAEGDLSQAELDRLLATSNNRQEFVIECRALIKRGLLEVAFERLDAYKGQIPLENMPALIRALCDLDDEFPEQKIGPFEIDLGLYAMRLIYFGLCREKDESKRINILKDAFNDTSNVSLPLRVVSAEQSTKEREQAGRDFLFKEAGLTELKAVCVAKIKATSVTAGFLNERNLSHFLSMWFSWGDRNEVKIWVSKQVKDAAGALWLLKTLLATTTSTGAGGTKVRHYIHLGFVGQFFDVSQLEKLTSGTKPDDLQGLDKTALIEFRKAIQRRTEGKSDDDWINFE